MGRAEAQRRVALAGGARDDHGERPARTTSSRTRPLRSSTSTRRRANPLITPITTPTPDFATGSISASLPIIAPRAWNAIHIGDVNVDVTKRAARRHVKRPLTQSVANDASRSSPRSASPSSTASACAQRSSGSSSPSGKTSLGAGTGLDVVRAQQDVETARATLVTGDESARQAREAFGLALGIAEDVGVAGELDLDGVADEFLSQCKPAPSIEERADVIAARERVHLAHGSTPGTSRRSSSHADLAEHVSTTTRVSTRPRDQWNVQAILSWTIWDGGARYGTLRDGHGPGGAGAGAARRDAAHGHHPGHPGGRAVQVAETSRVVADALA